MAGAHLPLAQNCHLLVPWQRMDPPLRPETRALRVAVAAAVLLREVKVGLMDVVEVVEGVKMEEEESTEEEAIKLTALVLLAIVLVLVDVESAEVVDAGVEVEEGVEVEAADELQAV